MKLSNRWQSIKIGSSYIDMRRTVGGVIEMRAENELDLQKGLGFAHSIDRMMQMLVTRILGRGELTQYFFEAPEAYAIDLIVRKLGFRRDVVQDLHRLTPEAIGWAEAYCEGVNAYLDKHGAPFFCKFFNTKTEPWHITDTMLIIKTFSYLGIAQQQERIERLVIHAIRGDVQLDKLKIIFSPYLDQLDETLISLIKQLKVTLPYFDRHMRFEPFQTPMSNNWVLSPKKTVSGSPFVCVDPHLQVNRLPSMWYEIVGHCGQNAYKMGITLPGFPGWIMGRTPNLSACFTYGLMDTTDFFIEEIKGGEYRRGDKWIPLKIREERMHSKKRGQSQLYFFESDAGVIERLNLETPFIEDGLYLSFAWSSLGQGPSSIMNCLRHLWSSQTVEEAQMFLWAMPLPANWVVADKSGNIGFQQSGKMPIRKKNGLLPLPAWNEENLWQGMHLGTDLISQINPECGFAASANDNKNQSGMPSLTTLHLPYYRYKRICDFLYQDKKFTLDDMKKLQMDNYSIQAELIMKHLHPLIPDTQMGKLLKEWNCCYQKEQKAPVVFEAIYTDLMREVFSPIFGEKIWEIYGPGHAFFGLNFGRFDEILLAEDLSTYKSIIEHTLSRFETKKPMDWGEANAFYMNYLLFDGKLPKFLGFDVGPIHLNGSRATVDTFQSFQEGKRMIFSSATYRMITDMGEDVIYSVLAGGVSEKKRSPYYTSDVELWKNGKYKKLDFFNK